MNLIESLFIGFAIAAIPGPIFFELTRKTLVNGFWSGFQVAIGEFFGNFLTLCFIFWGISNFLNNDSLKPIFQLVSILILFWFGISALLLSAKSLENLPVGKRLLSNSLLFGFVMAIFNPIVISLRVSLAGSYLLGYGSFYAYLNIFLITAGFLLFYLLMASAVSVLKKRVPLKYLLEVSRIFGFLLVAYGLYYLYLLVYFR